MSFAIAGGGTGGHVTPALALGEVLREAGEAPLFIGSERGIEKRLVPEAGFELVTLDSRPFVGRSAAERVLALVALARATLAARGILRTRGIGLVISVGGYASAPAVLAAASLGVPAVLVNTDAVPGAANRLLARFAKRIFVGFPGAADAFGQPARVRVSGVPLRRALRDAFSLQLAPHEAHDGRLHLFLFGGSQGARQINEAMLASAAQLDPARVAVVHQTGEVDRERVASAWRAAGFDAVVTAFERDMPSRYRWADLVVCRAGAISVAELTLAGRAALLIPLAHVGGGEQFANARELERVGGARVLDSRTLTPDSFAKELLALLAEPARLHEMGRRAASLARPDAADQIVAECRQLVGGGA